MQSTRFLASSMLRAQPASSMIRARATPILRAQQVTRSFRTSGRKMMPVPKEEQAGHTISQRLRSFKKIPVELLPLGVVLAAAIFAAGYSMIRKFYTDTTLRLYRQGPEATKH